MLERSSLRLVYGFLAETDGWRNGKDFGGGVGWDVSLAVFHKIKRVSYGSLSG